ncbi:hypothetical protein K469DRAFT_244081 [Zopfia rhizophila CBS 207.26]|uniref:Uncharacterized protein n=1 Tax=Zopfia rhizophila CBS 207.26 TaxID=1314779 RepID=A0A6A6ENS2_9PEZI|nr:hypothetical protein K469DRAFT_244081 [Zopfia rhizophila CBS 207.26]
MVTLLPNNLHLPRIFTIFLQNPRPPVFQSTASTLHAFPNALASSPFVPFCTQIPKSNPKQVDHRSVHSISCAKCSIDLKWFYGSKLHVYNTHRISMHFQNPTLTMPSYRTP